MSLVRGAKATLFPSLYEGFGLPVVESMLLRTPVLTSTAGALPEVAGEGALLVDPFDVTAIKRAIQTLDGDAALRADLTSRGVLQAAKFAPARYRERLVADLWRHALTAAPHILFDATRLANRARRGPPTGIDRVVLAYARWLQRQDLTDFTPVVSWSGRLTRMRRGLFDRLVADAARSSLGERETARQAALWSTLQQGLGARDGAALRSGRAPATPGRLARITDGAVKSVRSHLGSAPRGTLYLNVGHSGLDRPGFVARLAAQGLAIAVMIHDLIPITHPEFCGPGAAERHVSRLEATLHHAALIIANSQSTAAEIAAYAQGWERREPPVAVALLGLEEAFLSQPPRQPAVAPYFVFVGTIEARKNLALLLTVWRRLAERMGRLTPHLVLAGARGWENEAVIDQLDRASAAASLVHEIADLSDGHLASLVAGARALLAPSLAEGFDLPVTEAMALGCPVIASDIPVHHELAASTRLIDPLDGPGWLAAIQAACLAPARPAPRAAPTWEAHFDVVAAALQLASDTARKPPTSRARYG